MEKANDKERLVRVETNQLHILSKMEGLEIEMRDFKELLKNHTQDDLRMQKEQLELHHQQKYEIHQMGQDIKDMFETRFRPTETRLNKIMTAYTIVVGIAAMIGGKLVDIIISAIKLKGN